MTQDRATVLAALDYMARGQMRHGPAEASAEATIREAFATHDARVAELEAALADIAYNTSTSVSLGAPREQHYEAGVRRCIGIAARALAPGEPKPYTDPCPKCDGRGFTRETVDGQRESDKCGWCHGGGVVPGEPKEVEPPFARQFLSGAVPGHCFDIDNQTWHQPGERCTRCGFGIEARQ